MGGVRDQAEPPARWLYITLFLGLLFWSPVKLSPGCNFASQGFKLATNISYSFFYVLTVAHALHLLGGLGGLGPCHRAR